MATLDTGPVSNHVALLDNAQGSFAYVTVGGLNEVKVFRRNRADPKLVTTISVGQMPHGIWPSGDGSRVYIGLENGDQVQAIDTETNKVIATVPVGQAPQALVYVPNAVPMGASEEGLKPLQEVTSPLVISLECVDKVEPNAKGTVVIRSIGLVDQLQVTLSGLKPDREYDLLLAERAMAPYGSTQVLATIKADHEGKASGQALGPIRKVVTSASDTAKEKPGGRRRLLLVPRGDLKAPPLLVGKQS